MKIMIACPIQNRAWVLQYYLFYLYNLNYDKKKINLYWIINNSTDDSLNIIKAFATQHHDEYASIHVDIRNAKDVPQDSRITNVRRGYTYHWLAELRNMMLKKCVELDCDYMLSSDSDIIMRSDTIERLLAHKVNCVSALLYNGYGYKPRSEAENSDYDTIANAYKYPNILVKKDGIYVHKVNHWVKHPYAAEQGKLTKCDATGACIMLSKEICSKYKYGYYKRGEDMYLCEQLKKAGYDIYCDVSLFQLHLMAPEMIQMWKEGKL